MKRINKAPAVFLLSILLTMALTGCLSNGAKSPEAAQNSAEKTRPTNRPKAKEHQLLLRLLQKIRKDKVLKLLRKVRWRRKAMWC